MWTDNSVSAKLYNFWWSKYDVIAAWADGEIVRESMTLQRCNIGKIKVKTI